MDEVAPSPMALARRARTKARQGEPVAAIDLFREAAVQALETGVAGDLQAVATVGRGLAETLDGWFEDEDREDLHRTLIELGIGADTAPGYEVAAWSGLRLADVLARCDEVKEALTVLEDAFSNGGLAETDAGLTCATEAAHRRAHLLEDLEDHAGAAQALDRAIQVGQEAGSREALVTAAMASRDSGRLLRDPAHGAEVDEDRVHIAYRRAIQLGTQAGTPEGFEVAARAANDLGVLFHEAERFGFAAQAFEDAVRHGLRSGNAGGREAASHASLQLAMYRDTGVVPGDATEDYRVAIREGEASGTPDGLHAAARGAFNVACNLIEGGARNEAHTSLSIAIDLAQRSGTPASEQLLDSIQAAMEHLTGSTSAAGEANGAGHGNGDGTRQG